MKRSIFIHIGTHKTGTTSIQHFLRSHSDQLKDCGIFVPVSGTLNVHSGHHNIAWELRRDYRFRHSYGGVSELVAELEGSPHATAVISSEDFEYLVRYPIELSAFNRRLADIGYDTKYVVFFRNGDDYLLSLYYELKKHGVNNPYDWFCKEVQTKKCILVNKDWYYEFDNRRFVEDWTKIVGPSLMTYDFDEVIKSPGLLPFFLDLVGASAEIVNQGARAKKLNTRWSYIRFRASKFVKTALRRLSGRLRTRPSL
jgi:hypothetical protein